MERTTFADAALASLVEREFIPVRVDADLRPDVAERYSLGGWPSTLLLTHEGEILQGGTYLHAAALSDLLDRTVAQYRTAADEITRRARQARSQRMQRPWSARATDPQPGATPESRGPDRIAAAPSPDETSRQVAAFLLGQADTSGGFTGTPKFLHSDAIHFWLRYGDAHTTEAARRSLDAGTRVLTGPKGEAYRCAVGADWSDPVPEVTAESQAGFIRLLAEASLRLDGRYAGQLTRAVAFAERTWLSLDGTPLPTDRGADLAAACLAAARYLDRAPLGRAALALLERVVLATYRPGRGVRHFDGADAPSMLSDHLAAIAALLDARDATAEVPYSMLAEELGHRVLDAFFDDEASALRDRVHDNDDVGRLSEPLYPYRLNANGVGSLARLAKVSGEPRFAAAATRLFDRVAPHWCTQGLDAASCGIACLDLIDCRFS
jgi:uncharacterized protein YyaL (SSP411 family)